MQPHALRSFANYIISQWRPSHASLIEGRWHSYPVSTSRHWRAWKKLRPDHSNGWWCDSLGQAASHYSWDSGGGADFSELSAALRVAMADGDVHAAALSCNQIFDWGGVGKGRNGLPNASRAWVERLAHCGDLIRSIEMACSLLGPNCTEGLCTFDGMNLMMNSATTKVFAAADPSVLMYDGRVGAALGFLVQRYFQEHASDAASDPSLQFGWGAPRETRNLKRTDRNPSTPRLRFPELSTVSDAERAMMSRRAAVVARLVADDVGVDVREVEKALFMVGYRLTA